MTDKENTAMSSDLIPGPDPGACVVCGDWVKAGVLHVCREENTVTEPTAAGLGNREINEFLTRKL